MDGVGQQFHQTSSSQLKYEVQKDDLYRSQSDKLRRSWSNKVSAGGCATGSGLEGREMPELRTSQSSSGPAT